MAAVLVIMGLFFITLSIALLFVVRPWRSDFRFYSKEGKVNELLTGLVESNKQIISRLEQIEDRTSNI